MTTNVEISEICKVLRQSVPSLHLELALAESVVRPLVNNHCARTGLPAVLFNNVITNCIVAYCAAMGITAHELAHATRCIADAATTFEHLTVLSEPVEIVGPIRAPRGYQQIAVSLA
jgi:hypothetical protein